MVGMEVAKRGKKDKMPVTTPVTTSVTSGGCYRNIPDISKKSCNKKNLLTNSLTSLLTKKRRNFKQIPCCQQVQQEFSN